MYFVKEGFKLFTALLMLAAAVAVSDTNEPTASLGSEVYGVPKLDEPNQGWKFGVELCDTSRKSMARPFQHILLQKLCGPDCELHDQAIHPVTTCKRELQRGVIMQLH